MRRFLIPLLGAVAVLAVPGSAMAQSDGVTCSYAGGQQVSSGDLDSGAGELYIYVDANGSSGSSGSATAAAGACLNTNTAGGQQVSSGDLDSGAGELYIYVDANGSSGSSGSATAAAGACLNTNTAGNDVEGGTGEAGAGTSTGGLPGAYAVIDGDNDNVDPIVGTSPANSQSDGYIGLSNYEDGSNQDPVTKALECVAGGPDNASNSGTNSGGCIGPDGGPVWVPIPVAPSPICGNTSGNTWHTTSRDGCSIP